MTTTTTITVNRLFNATVNKGKEDTSRQQLYTDYVAQLLATPDTVNMVDNHLTKVYMLIADMAHETAEEKKIRNSHKSTFANQLRRAATDLDMEQSLKVGKIDGVPTLQYYDKTSRKCPITEALKVFRKEPSVENMTAVDAALLAYKDQWEKDANKRAKKLAESANSALERYNKSAEAHASIMAVLNEETETANVKAA